MRGVMTAVGLVSVAVWLLGRWWNARGPADPIIDDLIAANAAKPIPGMEHPDWARLEAIGRRRWEATRQAQQRSRRRGASAVLARWYERRDAERQP
jgi:hypothetical protein